MPLNPSFLSAIFSDESPLFRSPCEPDPGDTVKIRLRVEKGSVSRAILMTETLSFGVLMTKAVPDEFFDYYEAVLICNRDPFIYRFLIESVEGVRVAYDKCGPRIVDNNNPQFNPAYSFRFIPGFHVPAWSKGAVQYQIFTDRFCNGDPTNDVVDNEYYFRYRLPLLLRRRYPGDHRQARLSPGSRCRGSLPESDFCLPLQS